MKKKRLKKMIRYKDKALKQLKKMKEKISDRYYDINYFIRKMPPQYDAHK